ncbi:MAG: BlaI/MecI/CopY family transcriptional regulator [Patescibacteria group bacterium]|nr:BlaI/MecI/CopY family transcriptional regulator [Patescibacteria group bacterium]
MLQKSLSNLEQKVMDIVWECKSCSVRDVLIHLPKNKEYAYTTVATILTRLHEKGLVTKEKNKYGYIYSPKLSKELYTRNIAKSFLKRFINSFGNAGVASFAESIDQLPKEKRKYFLKLLEENEKNK